MRFGIISTAKIARKDVIPGIQKSDHTVAAISSRTRDRASEVAEALDIDSAFGDYETMFAEADIDAVYNPLPNALHAKWSQRAADHGLDVLCEKPLTVDTAGAVDLFDYCAEQGVTLMEAFMYQFHPRTRRAREIVKNELGEVHTVDASFKFSLGDASNIRLDPELAGGSLMDVAVTPSARPGASSASRTGRLPMPVIPGTAAWTRTSAASSRTTTGGSPRFPAGSTDRDGSTTGSRPTTAGSKRRTASARNTTSQSR